MSIKVNDEKKKNTHKGSNLFKQWNFAVQLQTFWEK